MRYEQEIVEEEAKIRSLGSCKLISNHYANYGLSDYGLQKHTCIYIYIDMLRITDDGLQIDAGVICNCQGV